MDLWGNVQEKTFLKWLNIKLEAASLPKMADLSRDLSDGVRLCQLMEIMSQTPLGRYNHNPRIRVQKAENVNMALQFIKSSGVVLTNIGPEDIIDGNLKLILGMIWTLILRFTIADISEEGLQAKEGLLLWCQRKTHGYNDVDIRDFSTSWVDGLALCALIHKHRPDLINFDSLRKEDAHKNTQLAFTIAQQHLGIPQLLEVSDVCNVTKPDERSIMTYVAQYFHAFSVMDRVDALARRVATFAENMQTVWQSRNDYSRRAALLVSDINTLITEWSNAPSATTYPAAKAESAAHASYKKSIKRNWLAEKTDLTNLAGNITVKLKTYGMQPWSPDKGLRVADLDSCWQNLITAEAARSKAINANLRHIKEVLRKRFADMANACENRLRSISLELAELEGPLESQLASIQALQSLIDPIINKLLPEIAAAEQECQAANIEDTDYTIHSYEDLDFETSSLASVVAKKRLFIENQIVSRETSKLTPAQLEEFESTFRHFDKENVNQLSYQEFWAALNALGIIYSDSDMEAIFADLTEGAQEPGVTYKAYIDFLVEVTQDCPWSAEQVRESFRGIAGDKGYVTEMDLKLAQLPESSVQFLTSSMPVIQADDEKAYDFNMYLNNTFTQ